MFKLGVHSEVGKLNAVMVCRPGLAHQRLTPGNCHSLLFDDVMWVHEAQKDHYDFVLKMQERGVEVLDLHDLLAQVLEEPEGRTFMLDRRITPNHVGIGAAVAIRPWLDELPGKHLAEHLIGGIAVDDLPDSDMRKMMTEAFGGADFVIPPIPNTLFQRDPSCWIYEGVTCNPMFWPARKPETLLQRAVYKFHPLFKNGDFKIWWGDFGRGFRLRHDGRRRRHAGRQGLGAHWDGRADEPPGGNAGRSRALQERRGVTCDCMPNAEEPGRDASGHGIQFL